MTDTVVPYRSDQPIGRAGFGQLLRAEWTKFRTVRGWLIGLLAAALVTVLLGLLSVPGGRSPCGGGTAGNGAGSSGCGGSSPLGPDGEPVTDVFTFVQQTLDGDGSITVRLTSLTGLIPALDNTEPGMRPGLQEWAKAGLIVKQSSTQGSSYAAIMMTADHGVRMQYDYTHDVAGSTATVGEATPRWLRLTRTGSTLTGFESADGVQWTEVGTATLTGLSSTVSAGMFVTSPDYQLTDQRFGGSSTTGGPSRATAVFDRIDLHGNWTGGRSSSTVGQAPGGAPTAAGQVVDTGGSITMTGSGDIAPVVAGPGGDTVERSLLGGFAGLIVVIVVGTLTITSEYRRGLIRTSLAASPRRGRLLAAKAIVVFGVTFVAGLLASALAFWLIGWIRRAHGATIFPVSALTDLRVVAGTAALLAVAAVLAMAVGTIVRRSAGAVALVIGLMVLPYILAVSSVVPVGAAQWLLRLTPAAGFAIQQSTAQYPQVAIAYTPSTGYFPLPPFVGFSVLLGWTVLALGGAAIAVRRRDA